MQISKISIKDNQIIFIAEHANESRAILTTCIADGNELKKMEIYDYWSHITDYTAILNYKTKYIYKRRFRKDSIVLCHRTIIKYENEKFYYQTFTEGVETRSGEV